MSKLTKIFPNLQKARVLLNQHAYEQAIRVYSQILIDDANRNAGDGDKAEDPNDDKDNLKEKTADVKDKVVDVKEKVVYVKDKAVDVKEKTADVKEEVKRLKKEEKEITKKEEVVMEKDANANDMKKDAKKDGPYGTNDGPYGAKDTRDGPYGTKDKKDANDTNDANDGPYGTKDKNDAKSEGRAAVTTSTKDVGLKAYVYIEYAHFLIKNVLIYYNRLLHQINNNDPRSLVDRESYDEDLEIAWEVLEQSRMYFLKTANNAHLLKVHFLQGEIHLLNDQYLDAIREYTNTLECSEKGKTGFICDGLVYKRLGDAHFFVGDKKMAEHFYEKSMVFYQGVNVRRSREMEVLLMSVREKEEMGFREGETSEEKEEDTRETVDVNHLIRRKKSN